MTLQLNERKTQTKNLVTLKPSELQVEDESERLGVGKKVGRGGVEYKHPPTKVIPLSDFLLTAFQIRIPVSNHTELSKHGE